MLMREGDYTMNLLKIGDKHEGLYLKDGAWAPMASIEADDLVALIEAVAKNEEVVVLDECNDDNPINNPIERTIYEEVYKVLNEIADNREAYLAECRDKVTELEKKYGLEEISSPENSDF